MGERVRDRPTEVASLQLGIDLGLSLIDTAEMYGRAEEVVGEAIAGRRDDVFVVSKVLPENASRAGTLRAAERSLRRLRTDRIDLYLLHWRGRHPLDGTLEAFERLREQGKILHHGVSNFDVDDLQEAAGLPAGAGIAANQVLYNLQRRGVERKILPWCRHRGVVVMAYSPVEQGRLRERPALKTIAGRHGVSAARVALAWLLTREGVVTIPKAARAEHVWDNAAARDLNLSAEDLEQIDRDYPVPDRDRPLEVL